jgi:hypothetical protein
MLGRQDGQIIPALVMIMLTLLAVGVLFLQVGRAAIFSTESQTAADAAALAAAKNVQNQLIAQVASGGTSDLTLIDPVAVRAAADAYAARNGAHVTNLVRDGVDVKVWVSTDKTLNRKGTRGQSKARARVELLVLSGVSGGGAGNIGPTPTSGDPTVTESEWDDLGKHISDPPTCGTGKSTNDLVKLAALLEAHGFNIAENAEAANDPAPGVHDAGGWHYKCRHSGALDVNHDQGGEGAALDALVAPLHKLGFRTIWRATGHFDHMHIDVANSPAIGAGESDGGATGPLEETTLDVRLIDWNAPVADFGGFGGAGGGGFFGGAPDPAVANIICQQLDRYHADSKVRLSAFETAIVESGVHNLPYGDADSLGVFQQRWTQGWGTPAQIMDPNYSAMKYITTAIAYENGSESAGQLAQSVQRSKYGYKYDQVAQQAYSLHVKFCGGAP